MCARLGLQSLAYLWQYDQSQLLEDMAEAGLECIIIKVAGAGLGLRHLGQDVCSEEMRLTLETLVSPHYLTASLCAPGTLSATFANRKTSGGRTLQAKEENMRPLQ